MEKISVIVPIYNISPYIERCVNSIRQQSFRNLQIILVNDGSTDNSLQVCERLRKQDPRITVIDKKNQGLGYARNTGLAVATGDYVTFVDGDDYLGSNMLKHLYLRLQKDRSDIACTHFFRQDDDNTYYFYINKEDPAQKQLSRAYTPTEWAQMETKDTVVKQIFYQAWGKLFKKDLFKAIEFPRVSLGEDNLTTWKLYLAAHKISYLLTDEYCWVMRGSSLTQADNKSYTSYNNVQAMSDRIGLYATLGIAPDFLAHDWPNWIRRIATETPQRADLYDYHKARYLARVLKRYPQIAAIKK